MAAVIELLFISIIKVALSIFSLTAKNFHLENGSVNTDMEMF